MTPPPVIGIVGPTASGKTDLALTVARRLPVEIIVADSRQVYRGMDIGTAKPDAAARAAVPHHLLDLAEPHEPFTVADWVGLARGVIPQVAARSHVPMLVGGTGLYVAALVDGHDYGSQPIDAQRRTALAATLETEGLGALLKRLTRLAPDMAAAVDRRNPRRIMRALERAEGGGDPPQRTPYPGAVRLIGLHYPREVLYARIDERARWLFANGLLEEVARLLDAGHGPELRPMSGHGYAEAMRHLTGEWTLEQAIDVTARRTRQYAKRQLTWFRRDRRIIWLEAADRPTEDLVDEALRVFAPVASAGRPNTQ